MATSFVNTGAVMILIRAAFFVLAAWIVQRFCGQASWHYDPRFDRVLEWRSSTEHHGNPMRAVAYRKHGDVSVLQIMSLTQLWRIEY